MGTAGTSVINSIWARLVSFITGNNTRSNLNVEQYWCHSNSMVGTHQLWRKRKGVWENWKKALLLLFNFLICLRSLTIFISNYGIQAVKDCTTMDRKIIIHQVELFHMASFIFLVFSREQLARPSINYTHILLLFGKFCFVPHGPHPHGRRKRQPSWKDKKERIHFASCSADMPWN